ncbi:MAG: hypothetical protein ACBZ72_13360 [Candidatus Bathyarchaeia archaeon]
MQTITKHLNRLNRFRKDKRAISTVITVMLSLVLIIIIVGNVFLASFQMNQLDMERMRETLTLSRVQETTQTSSPFTVQKDFTLMAGEVQSGDYSDTQSLGAGFETFRQESGTGSQEVTNVKSPSSTSGTWVSPTEAYTDGGGYTSSTDKDEQQVYGGFGFTLPTGVTVTQVLILVDANQTKNDDMQVEVSINGGSSFIGQAEVFSLTQEETTYTVDVTAWTTWTSEEVNDIAARLTHVHSASGAVKVDWIRIEATYSVASLYSLDIRNSFLVDLQTYPLSQMETIQIQLRYNVSSVGETWYIQAYDWATSTWSSSGFDNANGNEPATAGAWNDYVLEVPTTYVHSATGEVQVRFFSGGLGTDQTDCSIDYFAVTTVLSSEFQLEIINTSPQTVHVVALWVDTATVHTRYARNVYFNSGEAMTNLLEDIALPSEKFVVKLVTERGNVFVYAGN